MTDIRLFSTDLDGTLVGNPTATMQFMEAWNACPECPLLVYNSWRHIENMTQLVADGELPRPDFLIGGVGTEIVDYRNKTPLQEYTAAIARDWDLELVEEIARAVPDIHKHPEDLQSPYKSSWSLPHADEDMITAIEEEIAAAGVRATVIYTASSDLHILPARADKGCALDWLCQRLGVALEQVVVAGDQGSDSSMYTLPGVRGILVENAQPELFEATADCIVYRSDRRMASGVIDGLIHYAVLEAPADPPPIRTAAAADPELRLLFDPSLFGHLTEDQRQQLSTGYEKALDALRRNITPMGFSACSLDDNEVTGTDENYRSVWARDGCIATIDSSHLDDPDIRACQRVTLKTLLDATEDNGQAPANVRIDTGLPDFSGVGGICAIDSGLWLVIAVYNYVNASGDLDLAEEYLPTIRAIMNWLECHDANRDGLLEVPEASDWTDLFGRSYNVLYDEILWYRAKVCFGHLLNMLGNHDESARQMHASQYVRSRLLQVFWPSTTPREASTEATFADSQYSLGDARYLISEVSPFSFSWRCDVIGNLLGFLFNLLDVNRARSALSFMWGVGVNQPWPVANLYPVVQAGDADWKPYYTVNLLNLPHHYHNGGIWPFIGGMWVRFIYHLGQEDVAASELVKLAECCRQGRHQPWEFNEWYHGQTGRPMGKAYQAWSAASFIRACHVLHVEPDPDRDGSLD